MTTYAEDFEAARRDDGLAVPEKDSLEWVDLFEAWVIAQQIECAECCRVVEVTDVDSGGDSTYCQSCMDRQQEEDHAEEAARESGRWHG